MIDNDVYKGRFKKILNQMGKVHHHFFLHCLVKRRNEYTTINKSKANVSEGRRALLANDIVDDTEIED